MSFGRRRTVVKNADGSQRVFSKTDNIRELRVTLSRLFNHSWLSLHRSHETLEEFPHYDFEYESERSEILPGVDRKLNDVLDNLRNYFFTLDRKVTDQTRQFQEEWFRSFLATENPDVGILDKRIDFQEEKNAISAIFNRFEVPIESYEKQLDDHIEFGKQAIEKFREGGALALHTFFNMYDAVRLHSLVEKWQELQEKQKEILVPKSDFVSLASSMLYRKKIALNQGNEVIVVADDDLNISIEKLSSGEKQLLIFLAETLLQQKREFIFLADEPELSLHVEWQEQLVSNLLKVNPNAQVLFATHSPDIVGSYSDYLFSMEQLLK